MSLIMAFVAMSAALAGDLCTVGGCRPARAERAPSGELLVAGVDGERVAVPQGPVSFVAGDGTMAQLGYADGAATLGFEPGTASVLLQLPAGSPVLMLKAVRSQDSIEWTMPLPGTGQRETRIIIPPGEYRISLEAEGYDIGDLGTMRLSAGEELAKEVSVERRLYLTGTIRAARTGDPVFDAALETVDGHEFGRSEESGRFAIDVTDYRPSSLIVRSKDFGARRIEVPRGADDLGSIDLFEGETMFLTVRHPSAQKPLPLQISVAFRNGARWQRDSRLWEGSTEGVTELANLAPGDYRVMISGPEPLQQIATEAEVLEGLGAEVAINLSPRTLRGTVLHGDLPLPEASVQIKSGDEWEARVTSDHYGEFAGELWDAETLAFAVSGGPLKTPFFTMIETGDADPVFVDIAVPQTRLVGVVLDDGTRKPLPDAVLQLESLGGEVSFRQSSRTSTEGEYEFTGVMAGEHVVRANATGYLPYETRLETERTDSEIRTDIVLRRGRTITVQLRDHSGAPVAGAHARGASPDGFQPLGKVFTDATGSAVITVGHGEIVDLLSFQSGGSFVFTRIDEDTPESLIVALPPSASELRIRSVDKEGRPRAGAGFFLRYNGILLPFQVWFSILNSRGLAPTTNGDGELRLTNVPAGRYELFHFSGSGELGAKLASHHSLPPSAVVDLQPGMATTAVFVIEEEEP